VLKYTRNQRKQVSRKNQRKKKISVWTPTIRPKGLKVVEKALRRQTFKDFEWLIISPIDLEDAMTNALDMRILKDPPKEKDDYWSFNKAHNKLIEESNGELIVSIQDFTSFDPNALEKFWFHYQNNPSALVSGVGHKYANDDFISVVWQDPRVRDDYGSFYECYFNDIEMNFCSIPKKAFYDVGGFDEYLDKFAGMDHISVQERLNEIKYKFYLDQTNHSYSLEHGRPDKWDENHAMNGGYVERRDFLRKIGKWPIIDYLKENSV
jgi:hypothetical protein